MSIIRCTRKPFFIPKLVEDAHPTQSKILSLSPKVMRKAVSIDPKNDPNIDPKIDPPINNTRVQENYY